MNEDTTKKKKTDHVRFEQRQTVSLSLEEFKNGKPSDWKGIQNMRIEQDFHLNKPEDIKQCGKISAQIDNEEERSFRKIKNKLEYQKIQFKKVIDDLDLWQSELKQKKRNEGQSTMLFVKESVEADLKNNFMNKLYGGSAKVQESNTCQAYPEINEHIIQQILMDDEDEKASQSEVHKDGEQDHDKSMNNNSQNSMNSLGLTQKSNTNSFRNQNPQPLQLTYPKSMSQIPIKPVTLTSLKLKRVEDLKIQTVSRYTLDQDNKVVTKNDAQLQAEQNNIIINQIFKNKLSKIVDKQKPESKDDYHELVRSQTSKFQLNTLSNFKILHYLVDNKEQLNIGKNQKEKYGSLELKKLYSELFEDKFLQKSIHVEEKDELVVQNTFFEDKEKSMLKSYLKQSENSTTLKGQLNELRISLNESTQKIKMKEQELKQKNEELDKKIGRLEQNSIQTQILLMNKQIKNSNFSLQANQLTNPFEEQFQEAKKNKEIVIAQIKNEIEQVCEEHRDLQKKVNFITNEYQSAKESKNTLKEMLKLHYLAGLKQGLKEKHPKSLVWTIIKLFEIGEEVTYNIFPDYLDEKNIYFLLKYAQLEKEKWEKETKLKIQKQSIAANQPPLNELFQKIKKPFKDSSIITNSLCTTNTSSVGSLFEPLKNSWIKKPVFCADIKKQNCELVFELERSDSRVGNKKNLGLDKQDKQLLSLMEDEDKLRKLQQEIESLKEKEVERIYSLCMKQDAQCKDVLFSLFGSIQGEKYFIEFERKKLKLKQLIQQNKTFHFSNGIHQYQVTDINNPKNNELDQLVEQINEEKPNKDPKIKKNKPLSLSEATLTPIFKTQNALGIHQKNQSTMLPMKKSTKLIDAFSTFFPSSSRVSTLEQSQQFRSPRLASISFQNQGNTIHSQTTVKLKSKFSVEEQSPLEVTVESKSTYNKLSNVLNNINTEGSRQYTKSSYLPSQLNHRHLVPRNNYKDSSDGHFPFSQDILEILEGKKSKNKANINEK